MSSNKKEDSPNEKKESPHFLIRLPDVIRTTGLSRSTIYFRMNKGTFPKSVNLDGRAVAWLENEVQDWVQTRIEASRKNTYHTD
jgi:prophage regulatory protein